MSRSDGGTNRVGPDGFTESDRSTGRHREYPLDSARAAHRDEVVAHLAGLGIVVDPAELHAPLLRVETHPPEWFDPVWYLAENPDVESAGVDPFVHYVSFGYRERRWPNVVVATRARETGSFIDRILSARDVRTDTALRLARANREVSAPPSTVLEPIRRALAGGESGFVIAIGHDDYTANTGGVQLCAGLEQREFARRGIVHVYVHPSVPLHTLHPSDGDMGVRVVLDGVPLEHDVSLTGLTAQWRSAGLSDSIVEVVVVHSILGHSPERIGELIDVVAPQRRVWWIHDNVAQCPNWLLLRNGIEPCGAPPPTSLSCRLCAWGPERLEHLERLQRLWSRMPWEFFAPSDSAAAAAMAGSAPLPEVPEVVPHLELRRSAVDRPPSSPGRPTPRIGFIGEPRVEKGWDVFLALVRAAPEGCEFVHLGAYRSAELGIDFVDLRQTPDTFGSTVEAIRSHRLDAALLWPYSAETFGFVAVEAIAAGCEVLTHRNSGNVVVVAERHNRAVVFESVTDLLAADLAEVLRARRRSATPAWDIVTGSGLTPAVLDRIGPSVPS
jgi:glycosyltransferase involved in cell wall biosynthesis